MQGNEPGNVARATGQDLGVLAGRDVTQLGATNVGRDIVSISHNTSPVYTINTLTSLHQLPTDIADFTGRNDALEVLRASFREGWAEPGRTTPIVLTISGKAGVGKSALAIRFSHELTSLLPDAQLYVNLRGLEQDQEDPHAVLGQFLRALGVPGELIPEAPGERESLYRSWLVGHRVLVLLDNAADVTQVRPLLPATSTCTVLITSRTPLTTLAGAKPLALDVLNPSESVELLAAIAGKERIDAELGASRNVAQLCGHLPLALRVAAARLAGRPSWAIEQFSRRLADNHQRLNQLAMGDLEVRASFQLGYIALRQNDARMFRLLALLNTRDFSTQAAAALAHMRTDVAEDTLDRLVDAQLLEPPSETGRYQFHDLLRLFARERLAKEAPPRKQRQAALSLTDWYGTTADSARRVMTSRPGPPEDRKEVFVNAAEARNWFEAERASIVATVQLAYAQGLFAQCWMLVYSIDQFFDWFSYWEDWKLTASIARVAALEAGDKKGQFRMLETLATYSRERGKTAESIELYESCLQLAGELDDMDLRCDALNGIGLSYMDRGHLDEALGYFVEALSFAESDEAQGAKGLLSALYNNIGVAYQRQGKLEEAVKYQEQASEVDKREGVPHGRAITLVSRGLVYADENRWTDAVKNYAEAAAIFGDMGDRHRQAQTLTYLGLAYANLDDIQACLSAYETSLETFRELHDTYWEGLALVNFGRALRRIDREGAAEQRWREALTLLEPFEVPEVPLIRTLLKEAPEPPGLRRSVSLSGW